MTEKTDIQALHDDQLDLIVGGGALSGRFTPFIYQSRRGDAISCGREKPGSKGNMAMAATSENMAKFIDSSRRQGYTSVTLYVGGDKSKGQTFTLEEIESWL